MVKKISILIFLLQTSFFSFSQKEVATYKLKNYSVNNADFIPGTGFLFVSASTIEIILTDDSLRQERKVEIRKDAAAKKEIFLGAERNKDILVLYFAHQRSRQISSYHLNLSTTASYKSNLITLPNDEEILQCFTSESGFHLLTATRYQSVVNDWHSYEGKFEKNTYAIAMPGFYASILRIKELSGATKKFPEFFFTRIDERSLLSMQQATALNKIYINDSLVSLTIDEPSCTHLIEIDFQNKKTSYKRLNFSIEKGQNSAQKQGNSFVSNNLLFRVTASPEQLNLSIIDLQSIKLIHTYNTYAKDAMVSFANSPLFEEGFVDGIKGERQIKKTDAFFSKLMEGDIGIMVINKDSVIETVIGSYAVTTSYRPAYPVSNSPMNTNSGLNIGIGMGSGYYGQSPGMMSNNYYNPYGNTVTKEKLVYFRSLFDSDHSTHLNGVSEKSITEVIQDWYADKNDANECVICFRERGKNYYSGYYSSYKKEYHIVKF